MREVTEYLDQPSYFSGSVYNVNVLEEQWTVQLLIGANPVKFKINMWADVNIVAEENFSTLVPVMTLDPPNVTLESPGGKLACLGEFQAIAVYKEKSYPFSAYVVRGHKVNNLLSLSLSANMNLVRRVEEAIKEAPENYNAYSEHGTLKKRCSPL